LRLKTPNNESFFFNLLTKLNLNKLVFGSGQPLITAGILKTLPVMVPCDKEQTKVANFLNIIDKKIHLLTQKHDLLTQYKKGLVQQIFSQKLRLKNKDSLHFTDWKDFSLKNVLAKNSIKNKNVEFNLVQSISNKYGFINQDELFEDRVIASKNLSNYYVIKKGAFAYNPSRIDVGSLAYKSDDLTSVVSPLYVSFYTKADLIVDSFLLIWFDSGQFKKQMNSSFEGSVRNTLSYDSLSNMIITLPSIEEQLKISEFFKVMDSKITTTQSQLELLKQYKQGLLQQMFI
jgi:type I restriction enzyme S subunit